MRMDEFFNYKNQIMDDLLTNERIVRLLSDDGVTLDSPDELMYTQVHPYEFVPETIEHGHTFICCDVDIQRSMNKTYLMPVIYVWVFTHRSKMRLPEGGVRVDMLVSEIADCMNGSRKYGLGELDLYAVKRFAPLGEYQGKVMTFHTTDFNRLQPTGKPVPSNRKVG